MFSDTPLQNMRRVAIPLRILCGYLISQSVVGLAGVAAIVEHAENPGRGTEYSRYVHMKSGASDNFSTAAPKSNVPRTVLTLDPGRKMDGIAVFQPCSSDCLFP